MGKSEDVRNLDKREKKEDNGGRGSGPTDPDVVFIGEELNQTESWSKNSTDESESKASSDEDNDDYKDKNYRVEKHNKRRSISSSVTTFSVQKKKLKPWKLQKNSILPSDGEESKSSSEEDREFVVDSIINVDDHDKLTPPEEKKEVPVKETLPLIFLLEDEEPLPPEKEDWEKRIEDLFGEMDMCILESHIGFTNPSLLHRCRVKS
ncbi:hypothetical protein HAX54_000824 [Datura stramonium]|uniref:Uncharacterized protein n=1 Tax=Datura stramonium TaxID=4076 RepID=A0ABS8WSQ4_DATST|nr:hypothetical protein [Datura stramonium]